MADIGACTSVPVLLVGVCGLVAISAARSRSLKLLPPGVVVGGGPVAWEFRPLGVVGIGGRFFLPLFFARGSNGVLVTE